MLRNYLYTAFRQILKNKTYILINVFGLGVALACCITSYLLLAFNIEFDDYFDGRVAQQLYRVETEFRQGDDEMAAHHGVPIAMGSALADDVSGIDMFSRYFNEYAYLRYDAADKGFSEGISMTDSSFFDLINYKSVKGDLSGFNQLDAMVLNEEVAAKFFPDENPIGKVLIANFANLVEKQFKVIAVVEEVPINSTASFGVMVRIEHMLDIYNLSPNEWGDWHDPSMLIKLNNSESKQQVEAQMASYIPLRNEKKEDAKVVKFGLKPFEDPANQDDVYWSSFNLRISNMPIIVFITMAAIILLIASFNLTNTSVAMTSKRFKEIGIRKVAGATKSQIVIQFLFEMVIIVFFSLIIGLIISKFLADEFNLMWGLPYGLADISGMNLVIALVILIFIASMLAGIYPALLSTRFKPVDLIKQKAGVKGTNLFTKSLVTLQFALSIIVLICGIAFTQNTKFQEKLDYGYSYKDVLAVFIGDESEYKIMKTRAETNPSIVEVAITHHQLGMSSYPFPVKLDTTEYQVQHIEIGENFFEVMGLALSEGRYLDINSKTDEFESIVVNQAFLKLTGLVDPLGKMITVREQKRKIVGVVEDHIDNLFRSDELEPFIFYGSKRNEYSIMLIKANQDEMKSVMEMMESAWKEEFTSKPYQAHLQEEILLGGLRNINANMKKTFIFLTILGGLLSVAGIFALASINIGRRTKEIGIRKALGGNLNEIVGLLSKEFVVILGLAALIGGTGGYFLADILMDQIYAFHIEVKLASILLAVSIICISGLLTTSTTIYKAAGTNPVDSLRNE